MAFTWTEISDIVRQLRGRREFESTPPEVVSQPQPYEPVLEPFNQPQQASETWPVGSVFIAVVATDPALLLGYGTWSAFGAGRVLVGLDSGDVDFDTVEETGGAKTKAISDHADHTHDVTSNVTTTPAEVQSGTGATVVGSGTNGTATSTGASATLTHADLNVVQPYIVVHMWKRTA